MSDKEGRINKYLWHGYLPPSSFPTWLWSGVYGQHCELSYDEEDAAKKVDHLFDHLADQFPGPHLVPISGGWDSRLILAALRERLRSSEITTVSYGVPGQLDYEIGALVARHAGVAHHKIVLTTVPSTWEDLVRSVKKSPWTYVPNGFYESLAQGIAKRLGVHSIWSGFMGDPLTGGHLPTLLPGTPEQDWKKEFADKQRFAKSIRLASPEYYPAYPSVPDSASGPFVTTEWYDFGIRQTGCIAPLLLPRAVWDGWNVLQGQTRDGVNLLTPFCDPAWAAYWLNAPRELHRNQRLYLSMARHNYPDLFSLPSKYSYGVNPKNRPLHYLRKYRHAALSRIKKRFPRLRVSSKLMHNYLDFDEAFRSRNDYKEVLNIAIEYLQEKGVVPWLNLDKIVGEHNRYAANHGTALCVLLGLAVNLYAESENPKK